MSIFLTKIHVNKVFHLEGFDIELDSQGKKHLILTGKNGSGKTSLLNCLVEFLQKIKNDPGLDFLRLNDNLKHYEEQIRIAKANNNPTLVHNNELILKSIKVKWDAVFGKTEMRFNDVYELSKKLQARDFILAYYSATRKASVLIPKNPEKPDLNPAKEIKQSKILEFIKFLVDLKVQEALARNENQDNAADDIKDWFANFTGLLKSIFETNTLSLDFNYKDYSFTINQNDRKFGFNELSDGYSAIIDIVADLIIKMQDQNSLTRAYEKEGIVLIDEVETHLHLKLQRLILPMLTEIFPKIQFIVTTHSPFVLSSLKNAVAYDLERQTRLEDLTEYSYEALTEGYFKVETESSFLISKLEKFKALAEIPEKDSAELAEYQTLDEEFGSMDDALAPPNIKGQYLQIKLNGK
jgi:predicted ATP-binding protein involved in virulence